MLSQVMPDAAAPWDALWWSARIHLVIFRAPRRTGVRRATLPAGARGIGNRPRGREQRSDGSSCRGSRRTPRCRWCPAGARRRPPDGDAPPVAIKDIAADGFFSLGMVAVRGEPAEEFFGAFVLPPSVLGFQCRRTGVVISRRRRPARARAASAASSTIRCTKTLRNHRPTAFQSLYHFTVGIPGRRCTADDGTRIPMGSEK